MRTTILDDQLLAEAERYASQSGKDALREVLARRSQPRPPERVTLTTYGRGRSRGWIWTTAPRSGFDGQRRVILPGRERPRLRAPAGCGEPHRTFPVIAI
jgi:hypothetical protein